MSEDVLGTSFRENLHSKSKTNENMKAAQTREVKRSWRRKAKRRQRDVVFLLFVMCFFRTAKS